MAASSNPFRRGSRVWGTLVHQNHGSGGGNGSIMVGMFVCLCLVSKKPSEREFFVPARTDLGVKLLRDGVPSLLTRDHLRWASRSLPAAQPEVRECNVSCSSFRLA